MPERKLIVEIIGDNTSLDRAFQKSSASATKFGKDVDKSTRSISRSADASQGLRGALSGLGGAGGGLLFGSGTFVATATLAAGLKVATATASNLNEQISKSRQVFGSSSREIEQWAETTASSIGIANDQALEATGTFGNLLTAVGLGPAKAASMSRALVQLAADLASFNNASPEDALDAIRSGLVGEAEPLRRFGVLLSEARVQQQAMADTGKRNAKALTDQEKAVARYEIILRDTRQAQGDFARTSQGVANQQRIMRARLRDSAAELGKAVLPLMNRLIGTFNEGVDAGLKFADALEQIGDRIPGGGPIGKFLFMSPEDLIKNLIPPNLRKQEIEVEARVRGEEEIVAALNTVDDIKRAVFGGIPVIFNVQTQGLKQATSEIESLRSATTTTLGDVWTPPPGKSPEEMTKQRNAWFDAAIGRAEERAGNIEDLRAQNASLAKIASELQARIARTKDVTRRLNLEDELLQVQQRMAQNRKRIAADLETAAKAAHQKLLDAFGEIMESLSFKLERAEERGAFQQALKILQQQEDAVRKEIQIEGRTVALLRQLHDIAQERKKIREQIEQARRDALQRRQFRQLGLTAEGEEPVPGVESLAKRRASLESRLRDAGKLTPKVLATLNRIGKVLSQGAGKVGRDVRSAIERMLDEIADSLQGKGKAGPVTKGRAFDADKLLDDLGLTPEQRRILKARLSGIGPGGTVATGTRGVPGAGAPGRPFGGGTGPVAAQGGIVITGPVTVISDDPDKFHRQLQRKAGRRGTQTTGPHAGNAMGTTR